MDASTPYDKLTFDPSAYNKAKKETRASFSQGIADAGVSAGMAGGMTGKNAGRVVADVAGRSYSARDAALAQIEGQQAGAETQFNTWKQSKIAEAKAAQPGILDILGSVAEIGTGVASAIMTGGATAPLLGKIVAGTYGKFSNTGGKTETYKPMGEFNAYQNPFTETYKPMGSFNAYQNPFKVKPRSLFDWSLK